MLREILKSKIYYATVTQAQLYYEGSITVDKDLAEAADLATGEKVEVLNLNNGARFQTYIIKGKKKSGTICLNGPAARLGVIGDKLIILSYGIIQDEEVKLHKTKYITLNDKNFIKKSVKR